MIPETNQEKRIFIAEDDAVSRRLLQTFLQKWGYEIVAAADGIQAARLLEAEDAPRLAILDWMMPGVEGPELCSRIREREDRPYTYVLLLTARTDKHDMFAGLAAGADDYLTKPFDAQELRARLRVGQRILDLQSSLILANEKLRFQATHDLLTGLWNHVEIINAVARECSRQDREHGSFGVIMLDLDHFKRVNDTYGHMAGDSLLAEVARRLKQCLRLYDVVGRYGGEEFLIIAPSSSLENAFKLAERIRNAIGSIPIATSAGAIHVTASCGVTAGGPDASLNSESLVQMADAALYRAKKNGRNRTEIGNATQPPDSNSMGPAPAGFKASPR
jgi:two-component system, cell cycle response regulator